MADSGPGEGTSSPVAAPAQVAVPPVSGTFNADALLLHYTACVDYTGDVPARPFIDGCAEICRLISTLGSAFKIASDDVGEKVELLTYRMNELAMRADTAGWEAPVQAPPGADGEPAAPAGEKVRMTLQYLVQDEIKRGVHTQNDKKFINGSRTLLRVLWFQDLVWDLVTELVGDESKELKPCVSHAYDFALASHHGWILRKTIGVAINLVPYRKDFLKTISGKDDAAEAAAFVLPKFREFLAVMNPVRESLWAFYRKYNLTELP